MSPLNPLQRIRGLARRLFPSGEPLVADDQSDTEQGVPDRTMSLVKPRERVQVCGQIVAVREGQTGSARGFQADISDGTGQVTCTWIGRTRVPGVTQGVRVRVWGRATSTGESLVIFNPVYALQAA